MKQGRADKSGASGRKVEPTAKAVNPGGVGNLGIAQGNHATDTGTFTPRVTPMYAGRGFEAPGIGAKTHKNGSQGRH